MIQTKVTNLIGNTPLLELPVAAPNVRFLLKIEKNNPGGSMKDRMARSMVLAAIKEGRLCEGGTIVESSSGNTGIGLAIVAAELGLRFIAVVDHHAAPDKLAVMRAMGAELRFVDGEYAEDEVAVVERQRLAAELGANIPGAIFMNQSDNPANPAGYQGFVDELIAQTGGEVNAFCGCTGTGGSLSGIARGLKKFNPAIRTVGVEPKGSIVFGQPGHAYYQSGTGTPKGDEVGKVLDYDVIDIGTQVGDAEAFETARYVAQNCGLLVGGSTGGAIYAALEHIHAGKIGGTVVCTVADGGEKYLHTVFDEKWLAARDLLNTGVWRQLAQWMPLARPYAAHPELIEDVA
ncbi:MULTISPECIES: PLP-dependent cysteine synthase family protein [Alphaproteobacteria]|uniref:Cysteine synthase n=1 Tax=Thalassospira alkalitolerans TaxID=1293890 RepID=A0A1Y2L9W7_9PROT|nr:cysteine synthase family protein [Thalassospira alkalitolerans]OSQ46931.1 cysteine synthase [Thalassospira alkalitolerans]